MLSDLLQNLAMLVFDPQALSAVEVGEYAWQGLHMRKDPLSANDLLNFAIADLKDGDARLHPHHRGTS